MDEDTLNSLSDGSSFRNDDIITYENVFEYSYAVFIAYEEFNNELEKNPNIFLKRTIWWKVIATTRHLLAHFPKYIENEEVKEIIVSNMRNLYRLFGADLKVKSSLRYTEDFDEVYYSVDYNEEKDIYRVPRLFAKIHDKIHTSTYNELEKEFGIKELDIKDKLKDFKLIFANLVKDNVSKKLTKYWKPCFPKINDIN